MSNPDSDSSANLYAATEHGTAPRSSTQRAVLTPGEPGLPELLLSTFRVGTACAGLLCMVAIGYVLVSLVMQYILAEIRAAQFAGDPADAFSAMFVLMTLLFGLSKLLIFLGFSGFVIKSIHSYAQGTTAYSADLLLSLRRTPIHLAVALGMLGIILLAGGLISLVILGLSASVGGIDADIQQILLMPVAIGLLGKFMLSSPGVILGGHGMRALRKSSELMSGRLVKSVVALLICVLPFVGAQYAYDELISVYVSDAMLSGPSGIPLQLIMIPTMVLNALVMILPAVLVTVMYINYSRETQSPE